ncbi:MAG: tetratricopeptide repeat protein [Anaerolineae bacterium]
MSWLLVFGLVVGVSSLTWTWIQSRHGRAANATSEDWLGGALDAFNRGDLDGAIIRARQRLASEPADVDALLLLTRSLIYRSFGEYDRAVDRQLAVQFGARALARVPNDPEVTAIYAYALAVNGQPQDAATAARHTLEKQPGHVIAHLALSLAYGGAGAFDAALREAEQAATIATGAIQVDVLRALAIAYSDLGRYSDAARVIDRALSLDNRLLSLHFERALYAMQTGDYDKATEAYFQVLALDTGNVKAHMRLCELSSLLRETDAAVRYCTAVTELAPSWADGWYRLGREHFLQGEFRGAQEALHQCSTLQMAQNVPASERRFECWYLQGQAAEIVGDCPALITTYNEFKAMTLDPAVTQTWTYPPEGPPACRPGAAR